MKKWILTSLLVGGATLGFAQKGVPLTDNRILDEVRMKISADQDVKGGADEVTVTNGDVTIKGRVDSERGRKKATKLAKKVKGVKSVDNQLVVGPPTF